MKYCTKCKLEKDCIHFRASKAYKDGLFCWCNDCTAVYHKNRLKTLKSKEPVAKAVCKKCGVEKDSSKFSKSKFTSTGLDPRCKECYRDITRERRKDPKVRERARLTSLEYNRKNPLARKRHKATRRARFLKTQGSFTDESLSNKFKYYGNRCIYCKTDDNITLEHLIPLSRGGTNWTANLAPSCLPCNMKKNSKTHKEFLEIK
jgi:5-methylcytosine-specific restriction endonuclease McrA